MVIFISMVSFLYRFSPSPHSLLKVKRHLPAQQFYEIALLHNIYQHRCGIFCLQNFFIFFLQTTWITEMYSHHCTTQPNYTRAIFHAERNVPIP